MLNQKAKKTLKIKKEMKTKKMMKNKNERKNKSEIKNISEIKKISLIKHIESRILIFLHENPNATIYRISKTLNVDYKTSYKKIKALEHDNLIKTKKMFMKIHISLTKSGEKWARFLKESLR